MFGCVIHEYRSDSVQRCTDESKNNTKHPTVFQHVKKLLGWVECLISCPNAASDTNANNSHTCNQNCKHGKLHGATTVARENRFSTTARLLVQPNARAVIHSAQLIGNRCLARGIVRGVSGKAKRVRHASIVTLLSADCQSSTKVMCLYGIHSCTATNGVSS